MTQHVGTFEGKEGESTPFVANKTTRYAITCMSSGTRVEFVALAGQQFTVTRGTSHVKVEILEVISEDSVGGLQLVTPPAPEHS